MDRLTRLVTSRTDISQDPASDTDDSGRGRTRQSRAAMQAPENLPSRPSRSDSRIPEAAPTPYVNPLQRVFRTISRSRSSSRQPPSPQSASPVSPTGYRPSGSGLILTADVAPRAEFMQAEEMLRYNPALFVSTVNARRFSSAEKEALLLEILRRAPDQFPQALGKFEFSGSARLAMLTQYASQAPRDFCSSWQEIAPSEPADRLELAVCLAKTDPEAAMARIEQFALPDENARFDVARAAIEGGNAERLLRIDLGPKGFNIESPAKRFDLARCMATAAPQLLCMYLPTFGLGEQDRTVLAGALALTSPATLAMHIADFEIPDERSRIDLARIVASDAPSAFAWKVDDFRISHETIRIELAQEIARGWEAGGLAGPIAKFDIASESVRLALAREIAAKAPQEIAQHLAAFAITDRQALRELIHLCAKEAPLECAKHLLHPKKGFTSLFDADEMEALLLGAYTAGMLKADTTKLGQTFADLPGYKDLRKLSDAAARFGNQHPIFSTLLDDAQAENNDHARTALLDWAHRASIRFRDIPAAACKQAEGKLRLIQQWRAPAERDAITAVLVNQCLQPGGEGAPDFDAFCETWQQRGKFSHDYLKRLMVLLYPVFGTGDDALLERLATRTCGRNLRNVMDMKPLVSGLLRIAQAERLPAATRRQLLDSALQLTSDAPKPAPQFAKTTALLGNLAALANENTPLGSRMFELLTKGTDGRGIASAEALDATLKAAVSILLGLEGIDNKEALDRLNHFLQHSREPNALIVYAAKLHNDLPADESVKMLKALGAYVKSAVLGSKDDFRARRYSTADSEHLDTVAKGAPQQWKAWQQECVFTPPANFLSRTSRGEVDIAAYLHQRLMIDRHHDITQFKDLVQVLNGDKTAEEVLEKSDSSSSGSAASHRSASMEVSLLGLLKKNVSPKKKVQLLNRLIRKADGQFRADLESLKLLVKPEKKKKQDFSKWRVVDTDDAEDLLLCGTEVLGSCQNLYGDAQLNKGVLGYALDGKYRMVAVKSPDGRTQARAMLRLLWNGRQPVLHLERRYVAAGVPAELADSIVEMAKQKAASMGCALVTHEAAYPTQGPYGEKIHSLRNPWPFEYVDAREDAGLHKGHTAYAFAQADVIAAA